MYEQGIRRDREPQPFRMGGAFHAGLDLFAKGKTQTEAITEACEGYQTFPEWCQSPEDQTDWLVEGEIVARILSGYFWRWAESEVKIIASEVPFELPLRNPDTGGITSNFKVAGIIDKIVELPDGRTAIMEHKSIGEDLGPDSDYWKRLRIDQQISLYFLAACEVGHKVQTVLYDVARKPLIRPKKLTQRETMDFLTGSHVYCGETFEAATTADTPPVVTVNGQVAEVDASGKAPAMRETPQMYGARLTEEITQNPDRYYARVEIPRLDADLLEFAYELWQMQQLVRSCQKHGRWPRNTAACLHPFKCDMWELCTSGYRVEDPLPAGFTRVSNVHPELARTQDGL
jgi:hypothetical protein